MKMTLRYILPIIGGLSVMLFYISAGANSVDTSTIVTQSFYGPFKMLALGIALIGFSTLFRK